jgi:hypothetical protein
MPRQVPLLAALLRPQAALSAPREEALLASTLAAAAPAVHVASRARGALPIARRRWAASQAEWSCTLSKAALSGNDSVHALTHHFVFLGAQQAAHVIVADLKPQTSSVQDVGPNVSNWETNTLTNLEPPDVVHMAR